MSNTDRDSMLERWADGMETLEQYYEGKYGPPATPPSLPPITTRDAMLEAIADGMERAKRNINKKSPTYHSDSVAYVKTVPAGNVHSASLEQIGGKTVVWNQLINPSSIANRGTVASVGLTLNSTGDGGITVDGTSLSTNNLWFYSSMPLKGGHTYIITCNQYSADYYINLSGVVGGNTSNGASRFSISSNTNPQMQFVFSSGVTFTNLKLYPCLYDLTLMFGAGNEPTLAEFLQMFSAEKYSYNAGTLLSAGVTEVVSKKADTTTIATYPIPAEIQALEGYGWSAGSVYNYIDYERKVFVKCVDRIVLDGTQSPSALNWRADANGVGWVYSINLTNNAIPSSSVIGNIVSDKFVANSNANLNAYKFGIGLADNSYYGISIRQSDTSLTTTTAVNNYLANNPITVYYELATPQEIDISAYLTDDNLIEVEAGGSLTFPNSNGDDYRIDVPSSVTFVVGEP